MAGLYANENYPLGIVEHLRVLGHDVLTASETDNAGRGVADAEVLRYAIEKGRALITHNRRHFLRLDRESAGNHAGIIVCTYDPDERRQAQRVHSAIQEVGATLAGKVLRVYRPAK